MQTSELISRNLNSLEILINFIQKKGALPFATTWMGLESIMLSEISEAVKDKYQMISPLTET